MKTVFALLLAIVVGTLPLAGCASHQSHKQYSGFLSDYSLLTEHKDAKGQSIMRYVNPQLAAGNYHAIMIDPVIYYPAPHPDDKVDAKTLSDVRQYFNQELRKKVGELAPLVDKAGVGVLRMRVAITAVATENAKLKAYQYIPFALIVQGVKTAAGTRTQDADLFAELELVDSKSGRLLGEAMKSGRGTEVKKVKEGEDKGKKMVVLDELKPVLNSWSNLIANYVAANLHP
jgi:hypothetical protein